MTVVVRLLAYFGLEGIGVLGIVIAIAYGVVGLVLFLTLGRKRDRDEDPGEV